MNYLANINKLLSCKAFGCKFCNQIFKMWRSENIYKQGAVVCSAWNSWNRNKK